jgi:hypothetical protein
MLYNTKRLVHECVKVMDKNYKNISTFWGKGVDKRALRLSFAQQKRNEGERSSRERQKE